MRYYRVYVIDDSARITGGFDLHCEDNQTACEEASRLCAGRRWELWSGEERIHCQPGETTTCQRSESPSTGSAAPEG